MIQSEELALEATNDIPNIENKCSICNANMTRAQEVLIIVTCNHEFHRTCIENSLAQTSECPSCKRVFELSDLVKRRHEPHVARNSPKTNSSSQGKPRGAMAKRYNTRNHNKNLMQDFSQQPILELSSSNSHVQPEVERFESLLRNSLPGPSNLNYSSSRHPPQPEFNHIQNPPVIDYAQINQMIENTMTKLLSNLNIVSNTRHNTNPNHSQCVNIRASPQTQFNHNNAPMSPNIQNHSNRDESFALRPEKVTMIIQNWNVKFDGSSKGLNVEEFLYRVRSLTSENFSNDFSLICKNLPILLTGKALAWYWRYHKQVDSIEWKDFCTALRYQFKDFRSNFDIREEVRNRKMKSGESFETFYEEVSSMLDRLEIPMLEDELVEILTRNLRPDIRQELLYVPILSIAHLRKLVQMRENLMGDEYFKRNTNFRQIQNNFPKRTVADLAFSDEPISDAKPSVELLVDAVRQGPILSNCWNCGEQGHHWEDCLRERIVFCYGCGAKNTYKPQCLRCTAKKLSNSKN